MFMRYGEFCELFGLKQDGDTFRFWLLSHNLPMSTIRRALAKVGHSRALVFWAV